MSGGPAPRILNFAVKNVRWSAKRSGYLMPEISSLSTQWLGRLGGHLTGVRAVEKRLFSSRESKLDPPSCPAIQLTWLSRFPTCTIKCWTALEH